MGLLSRRSEHGRWAPAAAGLVLVVVLGGCSFVPDWADPTDWSYRWGNPVNWYDGVFGDDDLEITVTTASSVPGEDDAFPELSSVPERPIAAETVAARAAVSEGLVADREQARYTDEVIRAGPAAVAEPVELGTVELEAAFDLAFEEPAPLPDAVLQEIEPLTPIEPAEPRQAMMLDPFEPMPEPPPMNTMAPMEPLEALTPLPTTTAHTQPELGASAAMPVAAVELVAYTPGQEMLSQVFAQLLGESASTVTTLPANMAFSASMAKPMSASATAVPDVVRETYNAALSDVAISLDTAAFETSAAAGGVFQSAVIKFNVGSSRISESDRNVLKDVVAEHAVRGGFIRVVGHASSRTRDLPVDRHLLINFRVSLDRAEAVARELVRLGASSGAVLIEARSDAEPVYYESMPAGEAENRRVEIFIEL